MEHKQEGPSVTVSMVTKGQQQEAVCPNTSSGKERPGRLTGKRSLPVEQHQPDNQRADLCQDQLFMCQADLFSSFTAAERSKPLLSSPSYWIFMGRTVPGSVRTQQHNTPVCPVRETSQGSCCPLLSDFSSSSQRQKSVGAWPAR